MKEDYYYIRKKLQMAGSDILPFLDDNSNYAEIINLSIEF